MTKNIILGIDEAGRGSVIGPLVVAGVAVPEDKIKFLNRMGVKDSKRLSPKKRTTLARKIKKIAQFKTVIISAENIDSQRTAGINLNKIETNAMQKIISEIKPDICYIDCIDINENRFHDKMQKQNKEIDFITKHKADDTYQIVSASSIIAKTERDKALAIIREKYGAVGSGYPSDKHTTDYLKTIKNGEYPPVVRKTWTTIKNLETENKILKKKIKD